MQQGLHSVVVCALIVLHFSLHACLMTPQQIVMSRQHQGVSSMFRSGRPASGAVFNLPSVA